MKYKCISTNNESGTNGRSAVGLLKKSNSYEVITPYGLLLPEYVDRKDVTNFSLLKIYIKCIQKALNSQRVRSDLQIDVNSKFNPMAALRILGDYIENGVYREFEKEYVVKEIGKIDFKKTAKKVPPLFSSNEIYFNKFVVKCKKITYEEIVSIAQINVINHFMDCGGELLFGDKIFVSGPKIELNRLLIYKLQEVLSHSFNSRKQQLIKWIIDYINGAILNDQAKGAWQYTIISSTLWEEIIDSCISNQKYRDKTIYGKKYKMDFIDGRKSKFGKSTEHDTVFQNDDFIMIVDAKMYQYDNLLLSEDVLGKQFGYYREAKKQNPNKKIINILMLPAMHDKNDVLGFQDYVICDPHSDHFEQDSNNFILVYKFHFEAVLKAYYHGEKYSYKVLDEYLKYMSTDYMKSFIENRTMKSNILI